MTAEPQGPCSLGRRAVGYPHHFLCRKVQFVPHKEYLLYYKYQSINVVRDRGDYCANRTKYTNKMGGKIQRVLLWEHVVLLISTVL